jgi:hypothetical protein
VIEDLDGATVEPTRRGHMLVLSAATAAISLILLVAIVAPPATVSVVPQRASLSASPGPGPAMPIVWGNPPLGVNVKVVSECADGRPIDRPYYLVFEGNGQVMAVPLDTRTTQVVPFTPLDRGASRLTASCATSRDRVPRIDRGR